MRLSLFLPENIISKAQTFPKDSSKFSVKGSQARRLLFVTTKLQDTKSCTQTERDREKKERSG